MHMKCLLASEARSEPKRSGSHKGKIRPPFFSSKPEEKANLMTLVTYRTRIGALMTLSLLSKQDQWRAPRKGSKWSGLGAE